MYMNNFFASMDPRIQYFDSMIRSPRCIHMGNINFTAARGALAILDQDIHDKLDAIILEKSPTETVFLFPWGLLPRWYLGIDRTGAIVTRSKIPEYKVRDEEFAYLKEEITVVVKTAEDREKLAGIMERTPIDPGMPILHRDSFADPEVVRITRWIKQCVEQMKTTQP